MKRSSGGDARARLAPIGNDDGASMWSAGSDVSPIGRSKSDPPRIVGAESAPAESHASSALKDKGVVASGAHAPAPDNGTEGRPHERPDGSVSFEGGPPPNGPGSPPSADRISAPSMLALSLATIGPPGIPGSRTASPTGSPPSWSSSATPAASESRDEWLFPQRPRAFLPLPPESTGSALGTCEPSPPCPCGIPPPFPPLPFPPFP